MLVHCWWVHCRYALGSLTSKALYVQILVQTQSQATLQRQSLQTLAYDIGNLGRHAYAAMPPMIQSELACDQFIQVLDTR